MGSGQEVGTQLILGSIHFMQQNSQSCFGVWGRVSHTFVTMAYPCAQRLLNVIAGLLGVSIVLPLIPLIWSANLLFAPGPLFYRQTRVGRYGISYTMLKFRSMIVAAENDGVVWTAKADPRITTIGYFLRRIHLDELPQCWNILRGEMNLIGPRPERPEFVAILAQQIDDYHVRHCVKPGLTGWAQVNYGYGDSVDDARVKLKYDLAYIARQSWSLDLIILLRTFGMLYKGR